MKIRALVLTSILSTAVSAQVQMQFTPHSISANTANPQVQHQEQLRVIPEGTPEMTAKAYEQRSRIPVKMIQLNAQGYARLVGKVRGLEMDIYQFSGNAGDVIKIISAHATAMEFAIFSPEMGTRFGNHLVLPYTGVYELRIVNNRKDSARNRKARPYDVTFTLQRP